MQRIISVVYHMFTIRDIRMDGCTAHLYTVLFIKPYRNPVYKCSGLRQGFMKWTLYYIHRLDNYYIEIFIRVSYCFYQNGGGMRYNISKYCFTLNCRNLILRVENVPSSSGGGGCRGGRQTKYKTGRL